MAKKQDNTEEVFEGVEQSLTRAEQFLETNRNQILYVVGAIIVIVLGLYSYNTYINITFKKHSLKKLLFIKAIFLIFLYSGISISVITLEFLLTNFSNKYNFNGREKIHASGSIRI